MDLFERAKNKRPPEATDATIEGTIEKIVYAAADGSFTVARLAAGESAAITAVGPLLGLPVGARVRAQGYYENNPRFGRQFRVLTYSELSPQTLEGIKRYLGAGLIKGIGPEFAARIVDRFGDRTLEVLDSKPYRIREVPGIGRARAEAITQAWAAQRGQRDVMVFLQGHGVSPALAVRIWKRYGADAEKRIRENPYRLAFDVWGIGFLSADRLASALGVGKDSEIRVEAGLRHVLDEAASQGHVYLPRTRLVEQASQRLEVPPDRVAAAVDRLGRRGEIALEHAGTATLGTAAEEAVYETSLYRAERSAAEGLRRLLRASAPRLSVAPAEAIRLFERDLHLKLAPRQAEAIRAASEHSVLVVTGGPGVGKTTIVRGIVSSFVRGGLRVGLAAPTGRAAKRLQEATDHPAQTLHRLLEWRPNEGMFGRNQQRPLDLDLLVVDEASMLDVRLCADLVAALRSGTRLVLVGDQDQLPSVGPGTVLRDAIDSGVVPVVRLDEIFRQAAASLIVTNAHRIHRGDMPELAPRPAADGPDTRDFFVLEEEDASKAAELVRDLVVTRLPRRYGLSPMDIQVLAPMHRGELGAANLNRLLQEALTAGAPELPTGDRLFRVGDKVMQLHNDYDKEVFNGDMGTVLRVGDAAGTSSEGDAALAVRFDERDVLFARDELDELSLAYAVTVHKSQGSEYAAVVVPVHTQHYVMLSRSLIYTAVTRGKRLVVLVGTGKALALAVRNAEVALRCSRLADRLAKA